jgi:hypothetical protein
MMKYGRFWLWTGLSALCLLGAASYAYRGVFALFAVHLFLAVACLGWVSIMPTIDKPPTGWFLRLIGLKTDRQPMATAKSGGWHKLGGWQPIGPAKSDECKPSPPPPDGTRRPPPPPPPPATRRINEGVRIWTDSENQAACGSPFNPQAWARQGVIQEKQDLDRRVKSLRDFIELSEAFDRLDPVEQDLLRHQCEHMWSYSEALGARIANWRDGGGK